MNGSHLRPMLRVVHGDGVSSERDQAARISAAVLDQVTDEITRSCGDRVLLLLERTPWGHSRPLPLVAVAPTGIYLIDPLSFPGSKVRADSEGQNLLVDGVLQHRVTRNMMENCDALFAAVETGPMPEVNSTAVYCLVEGRLPWSAPSVDGIEVVDVRALSRMLKRKGDLGEREREMLHLDLAKRLVRKY